METAAVSSEMLSQYAELNRQKKELEAKLDELKKQFHAYFDEEVGSNEKGEAVIGDYLLQRQVRRIEKYDEQKTVERLERLNLHDLIKMVKQPDEEKLKAALELELITFESIEDCLIRKHSNAIYVKPLKK